MWESPVEEFEGLSMSALGTDEAYLRIKSEGEFNPIPIQFDESE